MTGISIEIDDMSLVEKARGGDIAAFETLFNRYNKRIYNIIYRMVGNEQDAGDLTQEVFVRIYNSLHTIRTDASFSAWIRIVAINICRDFFRKQKRTIKADSVDAAIITDEGEIERQIEDSSNDPQEVLEKKELRSAIEKAIVSLTPEQKEVVILHHIEGQDVLDIAKELNIPAGTVKSRLSRAREELKRKLGHIIGK